MPRAPQNPLDELAVLLHRNAASVVTAMNEVARTVVAHHENRHGAAVDRLRVLLGETMALSDLLGRRRTILWANFARSHVKAVARPQIMAAELIPPTVPHVTFAEAVADIAERTPELAQTGEAVADAYLNRHAFAAARSADLQVTERVQRAIEDALRRGVTTEDATREILAEASDWTRAYAETVYRTNAASAYAAGRIRQGLENPEIREILPAWEYNAVGDADTRPNHQAADGLLAGVNHELWSNFYPPAGYNCRCVAREVDAFELEERGLLLSDGTVRPVIPAGVTSGMAHPDKNFGGVRPDRRVYR